MESSTMETTTTATAVKEENTTAEGESTQLSPTSEDGSSGCNDPGKMFIGGLSWQTTAEGLRDYFGKFGEVNECMVMRDPATKRARFVVCRLHFAFLHFVRTHEL
ncbi:unnamed protein product [Toxocara canis]|uniref:RRM domain-containing protein n=1 Tax=Toxocara canis TaxID=6265 RepID=A0A183VBX7_TOXCA|nr:unnamed protein product [Toxocara canis]